MSNSPKIESVVRDATIVDVQTRAVKNGTMTIWEVYTQDGTKWTTSRADIGNQAIALKGQVADLKVSIQQNGQYTNYYVNQVQAGNGSVSTPVTPVQQAAVQAQAAQGQPVSYADYRSGEDEKEQRKNTSIHRQTAAKVAAALHEPGESPAVFWQNVEGLVSFFSTGVTPWDDGNKAAEPPQGAPPPQMPLHTGPEAPPPPHTDDDIPF